MSQTNKGLFDHEGFSEDTIERLLTDKFELDLGLDDAGQDPADESSLPADTDTDTEQPDTHRITLPERADELVQDVQAAHDDDTGEFPVTAPLHQELGQLKKRITDLEVLLGDRARELNRLSEEKDTLEEEAARHLASEKERWAEKTRLLEHQIEQLDVEKNQSEGQVLMVQAERDRLVAENQALQGDLEQVKETLEARERDVERERAATASLERELRQEVDQVKDALRAQQESADQRERDADEDRRELERRYNEKLEHWEQERQALTGELTQEREKREALEAELHTSATGHEALQEVHEQLEQEQQELASSNQELRRMLADMAREQEELREQFDALRESHSRQSERVQGILTLIREAASLAEKDREEKH